MCQSRTPDSQLKLLYLFSFAVNIVSALVKRNCENDTLYQGPLEGRKARGFMSSHKVRYIQRHKEGNAVSCDMSPKIFSEEHIKPTYGHIRN